MPLERRNTTRDDLAAVIREADELCHAAERIVIYGCGDVFPQTYRFLKERGHANKLAAIYDDSPAKQRIHVDGVPVTTPTRSGLQSADVIAVTFPNYAPCFDRLGIDPPAEKILHAYHLDYALTITSGTPNTICWLITSACNSRCTICNYWQTPSVHLDADQVAENINAFPHANHYLTGGEVFCHPHWREMLEQIRLRDYVLLVTNGLLPERAWQAYDEYGIRRFSVSLDGGPHAYRRIRGVDGYDRVLDTLRGLADRPGTSIMIMICLSPMTTLADFEHVESVCRELDLSLAPLIYRQDGLFGAATPTDDPLRTAQPFAQAINTSPVVCEMDRKFFNTYLAWREGRLTMPCTAGLTRLNVVESGNVYWCADKMTDESLLGNLYETALPDLLGNSRLRELADTLYHCNECWNRSCRRFDLNAHWNDLTDQLTAHEAVR